VSRWGSILLPFAGTFSISPREGITATHLIQTSDTAGLIDPMSAQFGAQAIRSQFVADGVNRTLAVRLNGAFKTAFPDGRPPRASADGEGAEEAEGVPAVADAAHRASGESVVVLFGDSDLLQDDVCVRINQSFGFSIPQVVSDNINLFVSAVEQASGDSALLAVRARGRTSRPYSVVDNLERKAQLAFLEKEKDLEEKLNATRQRLSEMQTQKTGRQRNILSTEQQAEIERFREEELRFRRELREVRKSLRHDIEVLGMRVKVLNILALPLLVGILGVGQGIRRRRVS